MVRLDIFLLISLLRILADLSFHGKSPQQIPQVACPVLELFISPRPHRDVVCSFEPFPVTVIDNIMMCLRQLSNRNQQKTEGTDSVVDPRETDAIYAGCSGVFYAFVTVQIARRHESITKTEKQQK
ncbi:uncharacterized protein J5F26_011323 [Ciconia maguari]